jgi:sugar phosphate isomerase/epimerase
MNTSLRNVDRRTFLARTAAAVTVGTAATARVATAESDTAESDTAEPPQIGAFVKFIQQLSYKEMAEKLAEMGFTGIEATVRRKGMIDPERVEEELPKLVEALDAAGLKIHVLASDVNRADNKLSQRVVTTAAKLGVPRYRMSYYKYDLTKPIRPQLDEFRPQLRDLVALNADLGIQAVYQNHAGKQYVGGTIWDIEQLVREHPAKHVAIAFDIRHATVEAGVSWATLFHVAEPHLGAIYVKDFRWGEKRPENVPLGEGRVDRDFFKLVKKTSFHGPFSLHVEYLEDGGLAENLAALQSDILTLKKWL